MSHGGNSVHLPVNQCLLHPFGILSGLFDKSPDNGTCCFRVIFREGGKCREIE